MALLDADYVVLDTELTSLDRRTNRLLSIGAVKMHGTRIALGSEFYRVMNPGVAVPGETVVIHKLRDSDIAEGEPPDAVLHELRELFTNAVLVGHFAHIDINVLKKEFQALGLRLAAPAVDTARVFRWLEVQRKYRLHGWEHGSEDVSLAALAQRYGIPVQDAHHALEDAFVTAQLWQRLLHELENEGIRRLGQLRRIGGV